MKQNNILKIFAMIVAIGFISPIVVSTTERISSDTVENIVIFIQNSNGNIWEATYSGFQSAVYDLNSTEGNGWVELPECNLTYTGLTWLRNNTRIQGRGKDTIFYQGDRANTTLFQNHGWVGTAYDILTEPRPNYGIELCDFVVDANEVTHDPYYTTDGSASPKVMKFLWTNDSMIRNVYIHDSLMTAIYIRGSRNWRISDCVIENIGVNYSTYDFIFGTQQAPQSGIEFDCVANGTISNNILKNIRGVACTVSWSLYYDGVSQDFITENIVVDSNVIDRAFVGIWMEGNNYGARAVRNCVVSNNVFTNITIRDAYTLGEKITGIRIAMGAHNITVTGNTLRKVGNTSATGDDGYGILLAGEFCTATGNVVSNVYGVGIRSQNNNNIVSGNTVSNTTESGIYIRCSNISNVNMNPIVTNNEVYDSGTHGIYLDGANSATMNHLNRGGIVSNNVISSPGKTDSKGIKNEMYNMTFSGNQIEGYEQGIGNGAVRTDGCVYTDNRIHGADKDGFNLEGENNTVSGNYIDIDGSEGIEADAFRNCSITDNHIINANNGIYLTGTSDNNYIADNHLEGVTTGVTTVGSNTIVKDNIGYNYDSLQDDYILNSNGNYWESNGANLQLAINDIANNATDNKGTVFLPAGTITVNDDMADGNMTIMRSDVHLKGAGLKATIIKLDDSVYVTHGVIKCTAINNFTISDLTVDGNGANSRGNCINIQNCQDFVIDNVWLTDSYGNNLRSYDNCKRGKYLNIFSTRASIGGDDSNNYHCFGLLEDEGSIVNGLTAWDNKFGLGADFSKCFNSTISNVVVYDCYYGIKVTGTADTWGDYTSGCVFSIINIFNISSETLHQGLNVKYTQNCTFSDIHIANVPRGLEISSNGRYCTFNNINIQDTYEVGMKVNGDFLSFNNIHVKDSDGQPLGIGTDADCYDIKISNSIFEGGTYSKFGDGGVKYPDRITLMGCTFTGASVTALTIQNVDYLKIIGCDFYNNAGDAIDSTVGDGCTNVTITSCSFYGNAQGIDMHATSDSWWFIDHNTFYGDTIDEHGITNLIEKNFGIDL